MLFSHVKKRTLKEIVFFFLEKPVEMDYYRYFHQWYSFALNIIGTKLFKSTNAILPKKKISTNLWSLSFVNKGTY